MSPPWTPPCGAVLTFLLLIVSAGCVGTAQPASHPGPAASTASAAAPSVDAASGSIAGLVVDDEARPVASVRVAILETNAMTTSDASGQFTFNLLGVGSYRLVADRLGYDGTARKVDVRAGEVTHVTFTLKAILAALEPYSTTYPRSVLITVDNWFVSQYTDHLVVYVNQSTLNTARCSQCWFVLHIEPGPKGAATEVRWTPSGNPAVNPDVQLYYTRDWTDTTAGTGVCGQYITQNPFTQIWPEVCVKAAQKTDKLKVYILGSAYGVSINHKVETYSTFGYRAELPENFTAFPPN